MPDDRSYMHGVDLLKVGDKFLTITSSSGSGPLDPDGGWGQDAYYSWLNPDNPQFDYQKLYGGTEAQEPTSAAINSSGNIFVTSEDGANGIHQYAGIWDSELNNEVPYPDIFVRRGGHSGHAEAMGDRFITTYSEGWQNGGGYDNLGTGRDIWARFVDNNGEMGPEIEIATGRNWWPVIASSDDEALVVWQKYEGDGLPSLQSAIITSSGQVENSQEIFPATEYYNYEVDYMPGLEQYLVLGLGENGAYGVLIDKDGNVTHTEEGIDAPTVREAQFAVNGNTVVYPTTPSDLAVLNVTEDDISLRGKIDGDVDWSYIGTDGIFTDNDTVMFVANTTDGAKLMTKDIPMDENTPPENEEDFIEEEEDEPSGQDDEPEEGPEEDEPEEDEPEDRRPRDEEDVPEGRDEEDDEPEEEGGGSGRGRKECGPDDEEGEGRNPWKDKDRTPRDEEDDEPEEEPEDRRPRDEEDEPEEDEPEEDDDPGQGAGGGDGFGAYEQEIVDLVNEYRIANGIDPVEIHSQLNEAAETHSQNMAEHDFFEHEDPWGDRAGDRIAATGLDTRGWGENIAAGYDTPEIAMNGWKTSPGHNSNMLEEDWTHIGVGYVEGTDDSGYDAYWTQNFAELV